MCFGRDEDRILWFYKVFEIEYNEAERSMLAVAKMRSEGVGLWLWLRWWVVVARSDFQWGVVVVACLN